jgi:hypothetical protein
MRQDGRPYRDSREPESILAAHHAHFFAFSLAARSSRSALRRLWLGWNSGSAWLSDIVCLDASGLRALRSASVCDLLLGGSLRFDHLAFTLSLNSPAGTISNPFFRTRPKTSLS